jgi:hypothetical protein
MCDERAQSEVIGYVIVASAVIVATGSVALFGVTALEDVREATITDNGEQAVQSIADDVNALVQGRALSRTTQVTLESGELETGDTVTVTVTAEGGDVGIPPGTTETLVDGREFRPIVYESGGGTIVYENTMVVRRQQAGEVAIEEPSFRVVELSGSETMTVVPVALTVPTEPQSFTGGTGQVQYQLADRSGHVVDSTAAETVTVVVEFDGLDPQNADVWLDHLNRNLDSPLIPVPAGNPGPPCFEQDDDEIRCQYETDRLVVSVSEIRYQFN